MELVRGLAASRRVTDLGLVLTLAATIATPLAAAAQTQTPTESDVEYYHADAVGSVRMVTNEEGAVIARHDYSPFGTALPGAEPSAEQPRGFTAKELDIETGFDYFGARHYSSGMGRFTTVDPVLGLAAALPDPQRWNRYTYSLNNPLKFVDPDGRSPKLVVLALKAGHALYKGYDIYSTVEGIVDAGGTLLSADATGSERAWAGVQLAGELSGVTDLLKAGRGALNAVDDLSSAVRNTAKHPTWLPSFQKVDVDWDHIFSGHTETGSRVLAGKDGTLFPYNWSEQKIQSAVKEAYGNGTVIKTQGARVLLRGQSDGATIEMWYNRLEKKIETAYPTR